MPDLTPTLTDSQKINLNIISLNTAVNDVQAEIKELNKVVLLGNGEIALREQVRKNTDFINNMKYWLRFVGGILITWVVAQVIVVLIAANWITTSLMPLLTKIANP